MTAITTYSPTGNTLIDGILYGTKWASPSLTFSFPTSSSAYDYSSESNNNFEAFTTIQQDAVRKVLANLSAVANVTFTEIVETSTQHATLTYAESDAPNTAWAYYPHISAKGGDTWFNNSGNYYDNPAKGNYAYFTMLHETAHAMGLKHAHEAMGSFSALPTAYDSVEYSIMSYKSYIGAGTSGYAIGSTSYPQTLMMLDIAALQYMYGANYTTNAVSTVYTWSTTTGEMFIDGVGQGAPAGNKIFMTLWDGGGEDTYDFSNYATSLEVDLNPGGWTTLSTNQLANLSGTRLAGGNIANALLYDDNPASLIENAIGGTGNDNIVGNIAANELTGGRGNDLLDGGGATDTAVYLGMSTSYVVTLNLDGSWSVTDLGSGYLQGADTLWNIEFLQFADTVVSLGATTPPPPPPVENRAPEFTSAAPTVSLTEWANNSAGEVANISHQALGTLTFADADAGDVHTVSVSPEGANYLGAFSLGSVSDATGSVGWSFSVSDSAMDYLRAGQTLIQSYDVVLSDGHGGTATQTVTIALAGADDPAVKTAKGNGKGKGAGNDPSDGSPNYHNLSIADVVHDQAAAPEPELLQTFPALIAIGIDQLPVWDVLLA